MNKIINSSLVLTKLVSVSQSKFILILLAIVSLTSCSVPGMVDSDNYGRNHEVYALDFNPKELGSFNLYKMNEGDWSEMGKYRNDEGSKFQISSDGDFLTVQANEKTMDVPTYQTWLNYAKEHLGYTDDSKYDVFDTVEEGWIYEIDLNKFPIIEGDSHRLLMYERK